MELVTTTQPGLVETIVDPAVTVLQFLFKVNQSLVNLGAEATVAVAKSLQAGAIQSVEAIGASGAAAASGATGTGSALSCGAVGTGAAIAAEATVSTGFTGATLTAIATESGLAAGVAGATVLPAVAAAAAGVAAGAAVGTAIGTAISPSAAPETVLHDVGDGTVLVQLKPHRSPISAFIEFCKKGTEHFIDFFSSESSEIVVFEGNKGAADAATSAAYLRRKYIKTAEANPDDHDEEEEEEEEESECVMKENGFETDDEECFPNVKPAQRRIIVLKRESPNNDGTLTGSYHLVRRLTRFLRVAGVVRFVRYACNDQTLKVFQTGASKSKDQVCHIKHHHASHVVKLQVKPGTGVFIEAILLKFLGHTHCCHKHFNIWIGRGIDTLQEKLLPVLLSVKWECETAENLSERAVNVLTTIRSKWLALIQAELTARNYSMEQREELVIAFDFIEAVSVEYLFSKIEVGHIYMLKEIKPR